MDALPLVVRPTFTEKRVSPPGRYISSYLVSSDWFTPHNSEGSIVCDNHGYSQFDKSLHPGVQKGQLHLLSLFSSPPTATPSLMWSQFVSFILGGVSFPFLALYIITNINSPPLNLLLGQTDEEEPPQQIARWDNTPMLDFAKAGRGGIIFSAYVHISEIYIPIDETPQTEKQVDSAQDSLKKLRTKQNSENLKKQKHRSINKLPRYWVEIADGYLHLYTPQPKEKRKLLKTLRMSQHVVTLWPPGAEEYELFYPRMAVCLISRFSVDGLVSLDYAHGEAPKDALFLYVENPTLKEDLYFAILQETRTKNPDESLGPRDPVAMAQPLRPKDEETMEFMNQVYTKQQSTQTMWMNALLGRLFLGVKDSKLIEEYWRDKIIDKLSRVNSSYFGEFSVVKVDCGKSMPLVTDVVLKSLTPEGELILDFGIDYDGGFSVTVATTLQFQWVSNISVEVSVKVNSCKGRVLLKIKPPPSSRMWYAFESMPTLDLDIEPIVSQSKMNWSIVTRTMSKLLQDVVRETMVVPVWDDISFYSTSDEFYRGGVWDSRVRPAHRPWREHAEPDTSDVEEQYAADSSRPSSAQSSPVKGFARDQDASGAQTWSGNTVRKRSPTDADSVSIGGATTSVTPATVSVHKSTRSVSSARSISSAVSYDGDKAPPPSFALPASPSRASMAPAEAPTPAGPVSGFVPPQSLPVSSSIPAGLTDAGSLPVDVPRAAPMTSMSDVQATPESFEWNFSQPRGLASSASSIRSVRSERSGPPILPPRKRNVPKLANVPPERATDLP